MGLSRQAHFWGFKRPGEDGFKLSHVNSLTRELNAFVIVAEESEDSRESLLGAEMDFFFMDGRSCQEGMDRTMRKLKEQIAGEEILGALMYSCNGRGPSARGMIEEEMSDAKRFAE